MRIFLAKLVVSWLLATFARFDSKLFLFLIALINAVEKKLLKEVPKAEFNRRFLIEQVFREVRAHVGQIQYHNQCNEIKKGAAATNFNESEKRKW